MDYSLYLQLPWRGGRQIVHTNIHDMIANSDDFDSWNTCFIDMYYMTEFINSILLSEY